MQIRPERAGDEQAISDLIGRAFAEAEHSDGTEAEIVSRLRSDDALIVSLVAVDGGTIVGHVAVSPVTIDGADADWFGLGPIAVSPAHQRKGIGSALVREAIERLRRKGASGCVLLGEPAYYRRFGFVGDERLRFPGPPSEYFQALLLSGSIPSGTVAYHPAFG